MLSVEEAIAAFRAGQMVIVVDDADRENEGDLVIAAEFADTAAIQFMARQGGGLICLAMTGERLDALGLPAAWPVSTALHGTAFTVSVDARRGISSGISASDRAATIRTLLDPATRPEDLARPGHIFPLRARPGGVLERRGHTEAGVDFARLAGLTPAAVICEILGEAGDMARGEALQTFAARWGLGIVSVAQLVEYRQRNTVLLRAVTELPTRYGRFCLRGYVDPLTGYEHLALVLGRPDTLNAGASAPLVRVHSECLTGDSFGSERCDCGAQLDAALAALADEGRGALIYLRQEGRGIGLLAKLQAYALQDQGVDTVEANLRLGLPVDARDYTAAVSILHDLGIASARLLTNNPAKVAALEAGGIRCQRVPLQVGLTSFNRQYLQTKRERMGHLLEGHLLAREAQELFSNRGEATHGQAL
jgi:3,4-dihydroxy 2-butanone 4-phosphate synthase/GTP cyclohydrolase II